MTTSVTSTAVFKTTVDNILRDAVNSNSGVSGVVAMATDRTQTFYEGAAGKRQLGHDAEMTTDTVFAIF